MLKYIYGADLHNHPKLRDTMFRHRADQFRTRLGWEVTVDEKGAESDEYDDLNPLYVIWQRADGSHGGSMRFLPTDGPTMLNDHFVGLNGGRPIRNPKIWECTRFCLASETKGEKRVAAALMLGGLELGLGHGLSHAVGVFDARMVRVYRRLGWGPVVLGAAGTGRDRISLGLWNFSSDIRKGILKSAGVSHAISRLWYDRAFGCTPQLAKSA